jgi:Flp pilus assembly protein TadG
MRQVKRKSFLFRREGASGAELALLLPLLALFMFAAIEVGRVLHDYQLIDKSVRHAARFLSRVPIDCSDPGNPSFTNPATFALTAEVMAKNLALTGTPAAPAGDYLLKYWTDPSTITVTPTCTYSNAGGTFAGAFEGVALIPQITVMAQVPIDLGIRSTIVGNLSFNVTVSHNEVVVGN